MHPDTEGQGDQPGEYQPPPAYAPPPAYSPLPGYSPPPGYGPPPAYAPPPGYGVPPYGVPGYGAPGYGPPGYGPPGSASYPPPPGYGYGWNGPVSTTWPYGPGRPGVATAAAVLGFVTAGLTLLMEFAYIAALVSGDGDPLTATLLLGIPCAAGQIAGGVQLLRRRSHQLLLMSAIAAVLVLILGVVVGVATSVGNAGDVAGAVIVFLLAAALPVTTIVLAAQRSVSSWIGAHP